MKITVCHAALAHALGVACGTTIEVPDRRGVPLSKEWRNRLRDAEIDGCVEVPQNKGTRKKPAAVALAATTEDS